MRKNTFSKKTYLFFKRVIDIFGSLFGIVFVFLPLYLPVAMAIKLNSEGPAMVGLYRLSQGKRIRVYKFRTMFKESLVFKPILVSLNERDGAFFKIREDPRITSVGRILRKFKLDELPQFFDVLKGELSLVGPRPHEPQEILFYPEKYHPLLEAKGGLTGLSQVKGASSLPFLKELELDLFYIKNQSLKFGFLCFI